MNKVYKTTYDPVMLASCVIFAILTGLIYLMVPTPDSHLEIDSSGYERIAVHFAQTSRLECPQRPDLHPVQTFAYPLFLGLIYKVAGHSYGWIVFVQCLLALLCGLFIYCIALHLFNQWVARLAIAVWSINLGFLVYVQFLLTEILFVTFLLAFLDQFVIYLKKKELFNVLVAGFLLGCSVVIKPAALLFIFPLMIFILLFTSGNWRKKIMACILCSSFFYLPVIVYMTRNKICYGHFRIAPMMDEILYKYFVSRVQGALQNRSHMDVLRDEAMVSGTHEFNEDGFKSSQQFLISTAMQRPFLILQIWFLNVFKTFVGLYTTQWKVLLEPAVQGGDCSFFKTSGGFLERIHMYITCGTESKLLQSMGYLEALWTIIRYLLILVACWYLMYSRQYNLLIFFIMYVGYFTMITGHDGCARYRMMIEPLLLIWSCLGAWYLKNLIMKHKGIKPGLSI